MGLVILHDVPLQHILHNAILTNKNSYQAPNHCLKWDPYLRSTSTRKRKFLGKVGDLALSRHLVSATRGDSKDSLADFLLEGDGEALSTGNEEAMEFNHDNLSAAKIALAEAKARQKAAENERDQLIEDLAFSEAKQQEYATSLRHNQEIAVSELEASKSMFGQKLQESLDEKFALESKLILAKQDAVELALQVDKLAEIAFHQATSHILEDAQQRVSAAETAAAEAAYHIEKQIKSASEGAVLSIIKQSEDTFNNVMSVTEQASQQAKNAMAALADEIRVVEEITSVQSLNFQLESTVCDLDSQLLIKKNEVEKLKSELEIVGMKVNAAEVRANNAEKALIDLQEASNRISSQLQEEMKTTLEKFKREAAGREKTIAKAFKLELESIKSAVEAAKMAIHMKDEAYLQRCAALERSLRTSEAAINVWRKRTEVAESLLQGGRTVDEIEELALMVNGGRIDLLTDDDSQKWKLLAEGPRREIPDYMARRIGSLLPRFPPRKVHFEELKTEYPALSLPKPEEVWSIVQEKPKQDDVLIKHVAEKEAIEKQRKALERVLHRKTIKRRLPEETKLEPGTGTGREILFQGFNWESWRRKWYQELAAKAADLSQSGITAVWFPPPTESVAPQGYMPSDLYNLNSAYGTVEDLKHSIEEIHAHDLLALGDVVLNHRCAEKQSPNGVWNVFGGNLAWGPEAIVCDDPNFQGCGNPSSGDIFHAAPNIDHSQEFVRRDIKVWLNWLRNDIGFDGWRLDFVRGFSGNYVKEYIEASNPAFAIGEYWDSLAYEGGNLCYNQDAHRQRIVDWINATGGTSSAFDVTTKGILHSALHNQYWRLIDPQGKPTGVMGWWPSRAVTFLENHDTGSTQGHWPFPRDKLTQGYAYILTHPGTPVIFYDHFYDFGLRETITELVEARNRAGIHCRSSVKIFHANNDGYVAHIGDKLVMKLGHFDWNPSKENQLDGSWQRFVDRGSDYQVWLRQ